MLPISIFPFYFTPLCPVNDSLLRLFSHIVPTFLNVSRNFVSEFSCIDKSHSRSSLLSFRSGRDFEFNENIKRVLFFESPIMRHVHESVFSLLERV